ncbi:MAG TPA: tetratricopeptide repeat protein, partial [Pyrinomonadaceae bacterium]|nr:tetratricopeptide repeat protein [Pyrinomonadaceae bacterium]
PKLPGPHFNLGLTLVRKGDHANAIAPLRRALSFDPNNEGAKRALAVALIGTERFQEASREIAQLLFRSPKDTGLLELAAQSFMRQRRYAEAVTVLQRRVDLPNPNSFLWSQYGDALDGSGRTPEAADAYKKAVALDPESTLTRYGLGYLYWKLYRYEDAERELNEVLRRRPKDPRASFTLGDIYLTKGEAQRALPFLEIAREAYPNEFDTRFALGRALLLTGNTERGIEELRAAVQLDETIADGHFQLGRALMKSGKTDEGKLALQKAQALHDKQRKKESERYHRKLP